MKKRLPCMCHQTRRKSRFLFCTLHNDRVRFGSRNRLTLVVLPSLLIILPVCTYNALCITHSLSVARCCLFCKALTNKPDFIYAISFIVARMSPWLNYLVSIIRLVCCYIPIGLCILSMFDSLPCSPLHAVVGVACVYLLIWYWDCVAIPTTPLFG